MPFNKNFKLPEALKFGDFADIGNGYSIELEPADPDFVWEDRDDGDINVKHQAVMSVRDKDYNLIAEIKNVTPYECTGGDEEISEENRKLQEEDIRNIIDRLPELLEKEVENTEEEISALNEKIDRINKVLEITGRSRGVSEPGM